MVMVNDLRRNSFTFIDDMRYNPYALAKPGQTLQDF